MLLLSKMKTKNRKRKKKITRTTHNRTNAIEVSWKQIYTAYRGRARRNNRDFTISKEEFIAICEQNCYYCGKEPKETYQVYNKKKYESNFQGYIFDEEWAKDYIIKVNGVDRVDPKQGYVSTNCKPACFRCNEMKMGSTEEEFYEEVKRIYNFKIKEKL